MAATRCDPRVSDRRFVLVLVLTALALLLASLALADEIIGGIAFDTSPFACDGNAVAKTWRNSFPFSVRLYRVRITHGRDYGVGADYYTQVIRDDGSWLEWFSQDAYSESAPRILDTAYEGSTPRSCPGRRCISGRSARSSREPPGGGTPSSGFGSPRRSHREGRELRRPRLPADLRRTLESGDAAAIEARLEKIATVPVARYVVLLPPRHRGPARAEGKVDGSAAPGQAGQGTLNGDVKREEPHEPG